MSTERMNPEVKSRWLDALRSGRYVQGRGVLAQRTADGWAYCCLGVLCELAVDAEIVTRATACACGAAHNHVAESDRHWYAGFDTVLPPAVMRWAGLSSDNPTVAGIELAARNDGHVAGDVDDDDVEAQTFEQIAQLIEEYL